MKSFRREKIETEPFGHCRMTYTGWDLNASRTEPFGQKSLETVSNQRMMRSTPSGMMNSVGGFRIEDRFRSMKQIAYMFLNGSIPKLSRSQDMSDACG